MIISLNTATALKFFKLNLIWEVTTLFRLWLIQKIVPLSDTEYFLSVIDPYLSKDSYSVLPIYFPFVTVYTK